MSDKQTFLAKQPRVQFHEIDAEFEGQRVDNYLIRVLKGVPKSRIYRIMRKGEVRLNGKRVKPESRLKQGDRLRIPPVRVSEERSSRDFMLEKNIENTILYESKVMLIINKPVGVAVHAGSGIKVGVIEALRQVRPEGQQLELVHRLDRGTSGCLMIAKKRAYLKLLQAELHRKTRLAKSYEVITHGKWPKRRQHVNVPIARVTLPSGETVSRVHAEGKESLTEFEVVAGDDDFTILKATPVTGRTHQIRVHCRHIGCPVVGDDKYGFEQADLELRKVGLRRMMLHASSLDIPVLGDFPAVFVKAPRDQQMEGMLSRITVN